MSALQPFLLVVTVLLVGVCARVCAGVYSRHRAALPSESTMKRWRRELMGGPTEVGPTEVGPTVGGPTERAPQVAHGSAGTADVHRLDASVPDSVLEERVLLEVLAARTRPVAILALNELTDEVSRCLEDARTLPPAVGRVALLGGTALGLTAMATALQNEQGGMAAAWGGACVLLAMAGAGVCGMYGRLARRAAERRREGAQELIRLLERRLPSP